MQIENLAIPFPENEILSGNGALENYFLSLFEKDDLMSYTNLLSSLSSTSIDRYATWLSQLTEADPKHRERTAFIYLRADSKKFIFPKNPSIGTDTRSIPVLTLNPSKFIPLVRVHSHPDTTCFSGQDLKRSITQDGVWFEENDSLAEIVTTPRFNYLLLRTNQTSFEKDEDADKKLSDTAEHAVELMREQARQLVDKAVVSPGWPNALRESVIKFVSATLSKLELDTFGSDFGRYYSTLALTKEIANIHYFAFYLSERNGLYTLVPQTYLQELTEQYGNLFEKSYNQAADILFKSTGQKPDNLSMT